MSPARPSRIVPRKIPGLTITRTDVLTDGAETLAIGRRHGLAWCRAAQRQLEVRHVNVRDRRREGNR